MIKAIIFDFDSTLVDYNYSDQKAIQNVLSLLPPTINHHEFFNISGDYISEAYDIGLQKGKEIQKYRLEKTLNFYGYNYSDVFLTKYYDVFMKEVKVYDYVEETLLLFSSFFKIGLLTNLPDTIEQNDRITGSGLRKYFDIIGISGEIGYYKPDKKAFDWVAKALNVNNNECIFIGDSEKYDIIGAKNAGMFAIKKIDKFVSDTIAEYSFKNYYELVSLFHKNKLTYFA
jgi:HAD superfamily hydrolase (TIGR01549 family)